MQKIDIGGGQGVWFEGPTELLTVDPTTSLHMDMHVNTAGGRIDIGPYAFFGAHVMLLTGSHDYSKFNVERHHATYKRDSSIILREGVWVAAGAIIVGPADIGEHSVVNAGAVLTGTFPAYSLIHGNPGHVVQDIRERITDPKPCPLCPRPI